MKHCKALSIKIGSNNFNDRFPHKHLTLTQCGCGHLLWLPEEEEICHHYDVTARLAAHVKVTDAKQL
jgi:hypothetical protein